jgi:hypothetical protein
MRLWLNTWFYFLCFMFYVLLKYFELLEYSIVI